MPSVDVDEVYAKANWSQATRTGIGNAFDGDALRNNSFETVTDLATRASYE